MNPPPPPSPNHAKVPPAPHSDAATDVPVPLDYASPARVNMRRIASMFLTRSGTLRLILGFLLVLSGLMLICDPTTATTGITTLAVALILIFSAFAYLLGSGTISHRRSNWDWPFLFLETLCAAVSGALFGLAALAWVSSPFDLILLIFVVIWAVTFGLFTASAVMMYFVYRSARRTGT